MSDRRYPEIEDMRPLDDPLDFDDWFYELENRLRRVFHRVVLFGDEIDIILDCYQIGTTPYAAVGILMRRRWWQDAEQEEW